MEIWIAFIIIGVVCGYGGVKAFQRNWLAALLLMLFFLPGLLLWALFECFTGPTHCGDNQR